MGVIAELNEPLTAWALTHFNKKETQISSGDFKLEIDTSKVRTSTKCVTFGDGPLTGSASPSGVVFKSKYVNQTETSQEHTFIMERTTEATVTTTLKKGFTKNGSVGIKLEVPPSVSNLTGGFGSDVTIETEDENTVKHSLTWSINSKVIAPPSRTTVAELRITEQRSNFTFEADVVLKGRVLATLTDVATGKARPLIGDLATILDGKKHNGNFTNSDMTIVGKKVTWKVEGDLNFRFGVSQDVTVNYLKETVTNLEI